MHNSSIVHINSSLVEVLKKIDSLPKTQTVFAIDDNKKLLGVITDGDIRRALIKGASLDDPLHTFMFKDFKYLQEGVDNFNKLKELRTLKLKSVPLINAGGEIIKIYDFSELKSILPIDAVIMAGGKGERLRPLTNNTPKPMLPLGNKPIIEHNIDRLISYGIENIYISVNYLASKIIDYFGDGSKKGINIQYLHEEQYLGTIGSIRMVQQFSNPYVLVMNSDLFTDIDFEDLYLNQITKQADLTVASVPYTVNIPFGIMVRKNEQIVDLKEKPSNTYYANAGIYLMKSELCKKIPINTFFNATNLIEDTIKNKGKVIDNPITGYWIDIGRHDEYNKAKEIVKHLNF